MARNPAANRNQPAAPTAPTTPVTLTPVSGNVTAEQANAAIREKFASARAVPLLEIVKDACNYIKQGLPGYTGKAGDISKHVYSLSPNEGDKTQASKMSPAFEVAMLWPDWRGVEVVDTIAASVNGDYKKFIALCRDVRNENKPTAKGAKLTAKPVPTAEMVATIRDKPEAEKIEPTPRDAGEAILKAMDDLADRLETVTHAAELQQAFDIMKKLTETLGYTAQWLREEAARKAKSSAKPTVFAERLAARNAAAKKAA